MFLEFICSCVKFSLSHLENTLGNSFLLFHSCFLGKKNRKYPKTTSIKFADNNISQVSCSSISNELKLIPFQVLCL